MHRSPQVIDIDARNLTAQTEPLLLDVLKQYQSLKDPARQYVQHFVRNAYNLENTTKLSVKPDLILYPREKDEKQQRYIVIDVVIGQGKYGTVFSIHGTIIVEGDHIRYKPKSESRIVKVFSEDKRVSFNDNDNHVYINAALHEYNMMKQLKNIFHPKRPVRLTKNGCLYYALISRRFPGRTMDSIIKKLTTLSQDDKLLLTKKILLALKEIHDSSNLIVHRDIKTENIMVDEDLTVKIFDLGLGSDKLHDTSGLYAGTPLYFPLETWEHTNAKQTVDIFSMTHVLLSLWTVSDDYRNRMTCINDRLEALDYLGVLNILIATYLNNESIPVSIKVPLINLLQKMAAHDPDKRPTLSACISETDSISEAYQTAKAKGLAIAYRPTFFQDVQNAIGTQQSGLPTSEPVSNPCVSN